jgi:hypothetical protein
LLVFIYIISICTRVFLIGSDTIYFGIGIVGLILASVVLTYLMLRVQGHILAKTFPLEYPTYSGHLRYVLFLRKLADQKYTREDIAKLRRAVEMAEIPARPAIQFNEHPLFWLLVIVPAVGVLSTLGTDFVKQADFWKGKQEAIATLSAFGVRIALSPERSQEAKNTFAPLVILGFGVCLIFLLIGGFFNYLGFLGLWGRKTQYQQLQLFLQWAEHDIEEEQLRRRRRLCEEMPGSHGPSH